MITQPTRGDALLEASDRELTMAQILEGRYDSQITASRMQRLLVEWLEERAHLIGPTDRRASLA
jgi:hypothetical protein